MFVQGSGWTFQLVLTSDAKRHVMIFHYGRMPYSTLRPEVSDYTFLISRMCTCICCLLIGELLKKNTIVD